MSYQIDIIENYKIVYLRYYDNVYAKEYVLSRNVATDIMKSNGITRLLICMKDAEIKSTHSEEFLFASELGKHFSHNTRIAAVVPPDNQYIDHHRFSETVCINRMINLHIFPDQDSAIAWLLQ